VSGYIFDWNVVWQNLPRLADGAIVALELLLVSGLLAIVVGIGGACARLARSRILRGCAIVYLEAMRNSPTLVKMYFIYFGLPTFEIYPTPFVAAAAALGLHNGAYMMEIFRAAIAGVPHEQREGAASLGLKPPTVFWKVVFPQALRIALAPLGNVWAELVKDTSLASSISVAEIYFVFISIIALTMRTYELFIVAAVFYLGLTWAFALLLQLLEWRLGRAYRATCEQTRLRSV
jgi:polar amino acid transport system permease protein/cystine transport system permease protein